MLELRAKLTDATEAKSIFPFCFDRDENDFAYCVFLPNCVVLAWVYCPLRSVCYRTVAVGELPPYGVLPS